MRKRTSLQAIHQLFVTFSYPETSNANSHFDTSRIEGGNARNGFRSLNGSISVLIGYSSVDSVHQHVHLSEDRFR